MAIAVASLTSLGSNTDSAAGNYTSASITPTANALVLLAVSIAYGSGAVAPSGVAGNSLTWVKIAGITNTPGDKNLSLWRAMGAAPSAGTVVMTGGAANAIGSNWSICEFTGVDTSGTNGSGAIVQSATASAGSGNPLSVTLASFGDAVNNVAYGAHAHKANEATTLGSGFTEIHDVTHNVPNDALQTEWRIGEDTSVDASWGTSSVSIGIAVEIKAAATGGDSVGFIPS